ncbi:MAG: hypothetical protein ACLPND_14255, partial [Candidatus Korobacteraceae bacterium]
MNEVANSAGQMPGSSSATGGVALSSGSRDADAKSRITDAMRRRCSQSLGPRLKAVVLTGSLARNEATWLQTDRGVQFLSDAEFIVIVEDNEAIPSPEVVTLICSGAEEELRDQGVLCKLSFGAVREAFLLNLGETIFGHELLTCGEVVYGDSGILKVQGAGHVSQEDAWRMLANRTVELLEIVPELLTGVAQLSEAAQYRLTKLYCDMATSVLVFKQEFVAGYQARAGKLCDLHARGLLSDLPFDADWFVEMVRRCTDYKISHSWDGASPFERPGSAQQAVTVLRSLWTWELAQMHGTAMPTPGDMLRLHMRRQALKDRLRGWAYVVRRRGTVDSLRHSGRWLRLLRSASPRYCVYAAGLNAVSSF